MGCCMFGCLTAPIKAIIKFVISVLKMVVRIILFVLKLVWKLLTLPFRLFRRSDKKKQPPESVRKDE